MTDITDAFPTRPLTFSAVTALGGAAPVLLPFRVQRQGNRRRWCWAAVTATISGYLYGIRILAAGVQLAISDPIYGEAGVMKTALTGGGYQSAGGTWTHSYVIAP